MTCPPFRCCIAGENGFTYPLAAGLEEKNFRVAQENPDLHFQTRPTREYNKQTRWWLLWLSEVSHCSASTLTGEKAGFILALICSGVVICPRGYSWRILFLSFCNLFFYIHLYCALLMIEEKPFLQSIETLVYCTQFNLIFWPFCMEVPNSVCLCLFMRDRRAWAWSSDWIMPSWESVPARKVTWVTVPELPSHWAVKQQWDYERKAGLEVRSHFKCVLNCARALGICMALIAGLFAVCVQETTVWIFNCLCLPVSAHRAHTVCGVHTAWWGHKGHPVLVTSQFPCWWKQGI